MKRINYNLIRLALGVQTKKCWNQCACNAEYFLRLLYFFYFKKKDTNNITFQSLFHRVCEMVPFGSQLCVRLLQNVLLFPVNNTNKDYEDRIKIHQRKLQKCKWILKCPKAKNKKNIILSIVNGWYCNTIKKISTHKSSCWITNIFLWVNYFLEYLLSRLYPKINYYNWLWYII